MGAVLSNRAVKLKRLPRVWFMTDAARVRDLDAALARLPRGAAVILRHYADADRAGLARRLAAIARRRGLLFLVAGDWRLAAQVRADGVHLPEHDAARGLGGAGRLWRKARGALLTAAAHGPGGLARGARLAASAVLLSPVFPTASHPERAALGRARAALMARGARTAVLALGGAAPRHWPQLRAAGFAGIAGIGFVLDGIAVDRNGV